MSDAASVNTGGEASEAGAGDPTQTLVTQHGREKIITLLRALSQRGKLPGFEVVDGGFRVRAYGDPFDYWLTGMVTEEGGGSRIAFELKVAPKMPVLFLIVAILTIQPGMWLTHSMLSTYFPWYGANVQTWWWYVPTCVLPLPWMLWRMWNKSKASAQVHAGEQHGKVAAAVEGMR